jgi:hypothetical protein
MHWQIIEVSRLRFALYFLTVLVVPIQVFAESLNLPQANSQRILESGKILATWPGVDGPGANFVHLFYVAAGGQTYLCRISERNRDIDVSCFARSTPNN